MLKYDTQNCFKQFTKTLKLCFQWNATQIEMAMCNCVWPKQSNVYTKCGIVPDQTSVFYWIKMVKYINFFKRRGTSCYDKSVVKYVKSFKTSSCKLHCTWKEKMVKPSVKAPKHFWQFKILHEKIIQSSIRENTKETMCKLRL